MTRKYNFSAGPSTLPLPVLEEAAGEFREYAGTGMSLIEMSHRGPEYTEVHNKAMALVKELLGLPDHYNVLFLQGGATLQFSMLPLNLLKGGKSCDFTLTGAWAKKAYADAAKVGDVHVVFDGKDDNYASLPDPASLQVDPNAAYLHMTSNETIGGIEWHDWPETGGVPIACDMSSDIMSRAFPVDKFGFIYAGAQKNLGPAGMGLVIIREDVLEQCAQDLPAYLSYGIHAEKDSLYNTPPVFAIYMVGKVLTWVKANGGISGMETLADERASMVYNTIDTSGGFYSSPVATGSRSKMNVVWRLPSEELEQQFLAQAKEQGMVGLKGHRSVGGCRASMYNAMPVVGAQALADLMKDFAQKQG